MASSVISHVSIDVSQSECDAFSRILCDQLQYKIILSVPFPGGKSISFGKQYIPSLWLNVSEGHDAVNVASGIYILLSVASKTALQLWRQSWLENGAVDTDIPAAIALEYPEGYSSVRIQSGWNVVAVYNPCVSDYDANFVAGVCVPTSKMEPSLQFYRDSLSALGFRVEMRETAAKRLITVGTGDGFDSFWLLQAESIAEPSRGFHIAFKSPDWPSIDRWHSEGLNSGSARDNGKPGIRSAYSQWFFDYYAAFLIDPSGYRVEAMNVWFHFGVGKVLYTMYSAVKGVFGA